MKASSPLKLHCKSVFATYAEEYVEQKQALGLKAFDIIEQLNAFDKFCLTKGILDPSLTEELYCDWSIKRPYENEYNRIYRIRFLRKFALFLKANGVTVSCKFHKLPHVNKGFTPYIFTHDEIKRLFKAVDCYSTETSASKLRHLVMPLLYRMLYTCGLRLNEALFLKRNDVNLEKGTLRITGKGDKDRIVPMSESLIVLCRTYCGNEKIKASDSEFFFPTRDGGWYDSSTIYNQFRQILLIAGICHGGRGKGPRLHDLRHTFAVHVMEKWASEGKDLYVILPILSTYLGHVSIKSTQYYLRLVPEAYTGLTLSFESKFGGVFPEVDHEE